MKLTAFHKFSNTSALLLSPIWVKFVISWIKDLFHYNKNDIFLRDKVWMRNTNDSTANCRSEAKTLNVDVNGSCTMVLKTFITLLKCKISITFIRITLSALVNLVLCHMSGNHNANCCQDLFMNRFISFRLIGYWSWKVGMGYYHPYHFRVFKILSFFISYLDCN